MTRTLQLTPAEVAAWADVPEGGTFWLVRDGVEDDLDQFIREENLPVERGLLHPPAEFVQACAPCETCGNARRRTVRDLSGVETFGVPCPDCRIELVGPCPTCNGGGMIAHCGRTDNGSDGPCVLAPHADNFPCYGEGDVASDWSPVSWCSCGRCSCGSLQAWTEQGPCQYCHEQPTPGTVILGHAYAVGQPLPITGDGIWPHLGDHIIMDNDGEMFPLIDGVFDDQITDRLAHYGPPESLVGKWALQVQVLA